MTTKDNIRAYVNIHLKDADEATKDDAIKNLEDLVQAAIEDSKQLQVISGLIKCDNCGCTPNTIYRTDKGGLCLKCLQINQSEII